MSDRQDQINRLSARLDELLRRQRDFTREIEELRRELQWLKAAEQKPQTGKPRESTSAPAKEKTPVITAPPAEPETREEPTVRIRKPKAPAAKSDLEKFIGENLINKIGIVILVIGVAIGAKYSIEKELLSPLTRIIMGYVTGIALVGIGLKLKKNYRNYSAVLVSGAMAIMYFITFFAYSFYELLPQLPAFVLMLVFTMFTVLAAIQYNRQVIALIGQVGAYAVPILLSDGSGRVEILFTYVAIINTGILFLAFRKYWKSLYFAAFFLTWGIYSAWLWDDFSSERFVLALVFLSVFFALFYLTFLAYKLVRKEQFTGNDIFLLLSNSFIFYGLGFYILGREDQSVGLFSIANAAVHGVAALLVYRQKLADRKLFFFLVGLGVVFLTITIPVQLDANWVTLLWAAEAALLFWIGRSKKVSAYERLSYPLIFLAAFSLLHDWANGYNVNMTDADSLVLSPIFNIYFLTSLLVISALGFIRYLEIKFPPAPSLNKLDVNLIKWLVPGLLLVILYFSFYLEIDTYWMQVYELKTKEFYLGERYHYAANADYILFQDLSLVCYSMLFACLLSFFSLRKVKDQTALRLNLLLNAVALAVFLTAGLFALSELRESWLRALPPLYPEKGLVNIGMRYVSFLFPAALLIVSFRILKLKLADTNYRKAFDLVLHLSILWIASSELINWIDIAGNAPTYKIGLSLLWGFYSLLMISLGLWKRRKHLRIAAILLFGVTLVKLFFYDLSDLDTLSKTIVFVSLGTLLLIISFLYNKYKNLLTEESEPAEAKA